MDNTYKVQRILLNNKFEYYGVWKFIEDERTFEQVVEDEIKLASKEMHDDLYHNSMFTFALNKGEHVVIPPKILAKCRIKIEVRKVRDEL